MTYALFVLVVLHVVELPHQLPFLPDEGAVLPACELLGLQRRPDNLIFRRRVRLEHGVQHLDLRPDLDLLVDAVRAAAARCLGRVNPQARDAIL